MGATALSVAGLVALAAPAQAAAFEITSISPTQGPTSGGTTVTITGNSFQEGFCSTFAVTFGGVGASFTINSNTSMTAPAPAHSAGTVDIRATNVCSDDFPDTPNTPADDYTYVDSGADVSVSVADSADPVSLGGDNLTYTLNVANAGPSGATGVTADTTLSGASAGIVSANASQGSCSISTPDVDCSLGSIAASGSATITVTPAATGTITATSTVDATESDPDNSDNTDAENTTVNNALGCTITGTNSGETLTGTNGPDVICGLGGNDTIDGGNGDDTIYAGDGNDGVGGGNGADTIYGQAGTETNNGETLLGWLLHLFDNGNDTMSGSLGSDTIDVHDGTGGDTADGGLGNDTCTTDAGDTTISC